MILKQVVDRCEVIEAGILGPLPLQRFSISHWAACSQSFAIHQRHHTIHMHTAADGRPIQGLKQRPWQSETAGFNNDPIQLIRPFQQRLHGRQEVVLHRAAEAAVVQLNQTAVHLLLRTKAAAANQITIKPNAAKFVDHHGQSLTATGEQMAEHRGLAGPKKPGDHGHRHTLSHDD